MKSIQIKNQTTSWIMLAQLPGLPSRARSYPVCCNVCVLSHSQLFVAPGTISYQDPLPMEFSRQEYWSRVPFPSPGYLPDPGIKPSSPASHELMGKFFTTVPPGKPFTEMFCPKFATLQLPKWSDFLIDGR